MVSGLTSASSFFSAVRAEDRAALYAAAARVWALAAGPLTALLIARFFSAEVQGFYYTFMAVLALQAFAELGMGTAIIQFCSHEWARLRLGPSGRVEGDPESLARLGGLARIALYWYSLLAAAVMLGVAAAGYVLFARQQAADVDWQWPWLCLCALSLAKLFANAFWHVLEGCNQVRGVYRYRFFWGLGGSLVVWLAIWRGAGLWTASALTAAELICGAFFLAGRYRRLFWSLLRARSNQALRWRSDILPVQWRLAVTWVSGYFYFSLFTPVLFHYHGPVLAGQMGLTWSLVAALNSVATAWVAPRGPQFGVLIAQRRYGELDRLFGKLIAVVTGVAAVGALAVYLAVAALNHWGHFAAARLLPPAHTGLLALSAVAFSPAAALAVYLRAHKREPLMWPSLAGGAAVALSTWLLGREYAALGVTAGYTAIMFIAAVAAFFIWRRCRADWHRHPQDGPV